VAAGALATASGCGRMKLWCWARDGHLKFGSAAASSGGVKTSRREGHRCGLGWNRTRNLSGWAERFEGALRQAHAATCGGLAVRAISRIYMCGAFDLLRRVSCIAVHSSDGLCAWRLGAAAATLLLFERLRGRCWLQRACAGAAGRRTCWQGLSGCACLTCTPATCPTTRSPVPPAARCLSGNLPLHSSLLLSVSISLLLLPPVLYAALSCLSCARTPAWRAERVTPGA